MRVKYTTNDLFKSKINKRLKKLDIAEGTGYMLLKKENINHLKFGFNIEQIIRDHGGRI
jgi:hypothetical protein